MKRILTNLCCFDFVPKQNFLNSSSINFGSFLTSSTNEAENSSIVFTHTATQNEQKID